MINENDRGNKIVSKTLQSPQFHDKNCKYFIMLYLLASLELEGRLFKILITTIFQDCP